MGFKSYYQWATLALAVTTAAQTTTSCNPTKKTCPADTGLNKYHLSTDFTSGSLGRWKTTAGTVTTTDLGAKFTVSEQGDAPTIESEFYIFFGHIDVNMKAANGTGIISTWILESDDLDEIDWEQVSTYGTEIQTDYFGKGNTTSYDRGTTVTVSAPEETFHTYSVDWTSERIEWLVDGDVVRTVRYADAVDGTNYPQTPMRIRIGIWAGGDPDNSEGTIEWAGGETDYTEGPFSMYVQSVDIINYNPASAYKYTDKTGDYTSIKATNATTSTNLSSLNSSLIAASSKSSTSTEDSSSNSSSVVASSKTSASVEASSSLVASSSASASAAASSVDFFSAAPVSYYTSIFSMALGSFVAGLVQF
ncbi:Concanavalin A-like lectin/glucanase, subgroup [Penicillium italicum]|uniref:Crh-like protein n=1 Tax=Penicillium italicum TaxID=40296 RepID=A0A0A2L0V5_PENIT|nr:Concanavalin A-like lectin/glucanase, subgroup [Penicillium italicum]